VALEQFLRAQPVVLAVEFISKARAIERFRADFPELNDVTTSLADNPFPASLEVRLRTDPTSGADADALARSLGGREGVADVRYDRQWLARLQSLVTAGRVAGALVAGVLMLGAAFTVAAVVRLSMHARRDELDIMQLVGAPISFIRGPSVVEGVLLGGAGAAVALAALWALYLAVGGWLGHDLAGIIGSGQLRFLGVRSVAILLGGGLGIGAGAGALVARSVR
jgi:cell division transport system permease protein